MALLSLGAAKKVSHASGTIALDGKIPQFA